MKPSIFLIPLFCCIINLSIAQKGVTFVGADVGIQFLEAPFIYTEKIRSDIGSAFSDDQRAGLRSSATTAFGGVRIESFLFNDRFSFSTGLNFAQTQAVVRERYSSLFSGGNFFFYRFREEGLDTEYASIVKINQTTDYLAIPLRVRYFPLKLRTFRLYFFGGTSFALKVNSRYQIDFHHDNLSEIQDQIVADFRKPKAVNVDGFLGAGIRLGKIGKPLVGVEIAAPAFCLSADANGIVEPETGVNIQCSLSIPLNPKTDD